MIKRKIYDLQIVDEKDLRDIRDKFFELIDYLQEYHRSEITFNIRYEYD